jgi:hypothetical protein
MKYAAATVLGRPPKARMLYYDDGRHASAYTVEPLLGAGGPHALDVVHAVDAVANTMVDVFVLGLGTGRTSHGL